VRTAGGGARSSEVGVDCRGNEHQIVVGRASKVVGEQRARAATRRPAKTWIAVGRRVAKPGAGVGQQSVPVPVLLDDGGSRISRTGPLDPGQVDHLLHRDAASPGRSTRGARRGSRSFGVVRARGRGPSGLVGPTRLQREASPVCWTSAGTVDARAGRSVNADTHGGPGCHGRSGDTVGQGPALRLSIAVPPRATRLRLANRRNGCEPPAGPSSDGGALAESRDDAAPSAGASDPGASGLSRRAWVMVLLLDFSSSHEFRRWSSTSR